MLATVLIVRVCYVLYCRAHFPDCRYRPVYDRKLLKEMFSFAGWDFIGTTSGVLRDQGGNILVNVFFGTVMNAARGVAVQLSSAVQGFVTNFMTAVNPQITKSYAAGEHQYTFSLVRKASRMSYYLLFIFALPLLFSTDFVLDLWLKDVPADTVAFVRLFLVFSLSESLARPMITTLLAHGDIRNYQIIVGRENNTDTFQINVEMTEELLGDGVKGIERTEKQITEGLRSMLGIGPKVCLVNPKSIARSEGKAKRVIDNRKLK
jgi:O-antigen/teichoic acid export membrane protein